MILEPDWSPQRFTATLRNMIDHPERLTGMENALSSLAVDDAAGKIAVLALTMTPRRT
jgi:UDP-N-acetylglucosamine:LPS N-acetylglucosamine transferase